MRIFQAVFFFKSVYIGRIARSPWRWHSFLVNYVLARAQYCLAALLRVWHS